VLCHGHVPAYFFFFARELRDRSLERDREVSRTDSCVWPGGQAGRSFCLGRLAGKMSFFSFCLFILVCVM